MTPALRKRHQRTWWFLGVALLLIWGISMMSISKQNVVYNPIIKIDKGRDFVVTLIKGETPSTSKIGIEILEVISSPQALVYLAPSKETSIENSQLLGRLDGKGIYQFPLDSMSTAMPKKVIKVFNSIKQEELFQASIN